MLNILGNSQQQAITPLWAAGIVAQTAPSPGRPVVRHWHPPPGGLLILQCVHTNNYTLSSISCAKITLSWPKLLALQKFFQRIKYFSQKSIAVTHVLLYTCLFPLCVLEQNKKREEKKQIGHNVTQNSKNGLVKILGTLSKLWINKIVSSMWCSFKLTWGK